jgi:hypothetical protein
MTDRCLGYGPLEGKCTEPAGTPWSPYWCQRCDELRRETISRELNAFIANLKERRKLESKS